MSIEPNKIEFRDLGLCAYGEALAHQQHWHKKIMLGEHPGVILFVEHPSVVTMGKHADRQFLKLSSEDFSQAGIEFFETDRGGQVTGHEPGQLVVYPILKLKDIGLTPKSYVCLLEKAVIATLGRYGVKAHTDEQNPGVWVGADKICAVGVRIKDRVTMHGIAVNVKNDLSVFSAMVPCGIIGKGVCSLASKVSGEVEMKAFKEAFSETISALLGLKESPS